MQDTHCAEEIKFGRRQLLVGASLAGAIATLPKAAHAAQNAELTNAAQAVTASRCPYGVSKLEHKYAVVSRPALDRLQELVGLGEVEQTETPVMRLYSEWAKLRDLSDAPGGSDDETDELCLQAHRVLARMLKTPAQSEGDMLRQVFAMSNRGEALYFEAKMADSAVERIAAALA